VRDKYAIFSAVIRCISLGIWLCCFVPLQAQFYNGHLIDEKSGLSDVRVRAIDKDNYGFVWIGTENGLNRFDGSQFRQFLHDPNDPGSILNNLTIDLVIDSQVVWVGGSYGISAINLSDFSIQNVQFDCDHILDSIDLNYAKRPEVSFLHLDDGFLWICTSECGLIRYDIAERTMRHISFASHSAETPGIVSSEALDRILGFAEDPVMDSIYWIGTGAGMIRLNNQTFTHRHFYFSSPDLLYQDAINTCRRIIYDADGLIYYLTWGYGVNVFDPQKSEFYPLPWEGESTLELRTNISDLKQHSPNNLWLRTAKGLHLYNTGLHKVINFYPNQDNSLQYYPVGFVDKSDRRYFATNEGMIAFDPLYEQFLVFSYEELSVPGWYGFARKVIAHPDGNLVTVVGQGVDALYHFSHRENRWFKTPIPGYSAKPGEGFNGIDMDVDSIGGWAFAGADGIYMFDPVAFKVKEIDLGIDLARKKFADIEWDKQGNLWIGTRHEGILCWNPETGHTTQFLNEIYGDNAGSKSPFATQLFCDSRGNIWFKTAYGHSVHNSVTGEFHNFDSQSNTRKSLTDIASFAEDIHHRIWVVSHRGILARGSADDPAQELEIQFSVFPEEETPTYVEGIVYGEDRRLYVLSANTLFQIDSTMAISPFSMDYASFKGDYYLFDHLSESSLVVGLRNGFAVLYSTGLRRNKELPSPYVTQITVNEKPLNGNYLTTTPLLSLKHNENFLSFSFSAISFTLPEKNHFQYRLYGFDPDWIDAGERRFANYTNIPSGDYAFQLQVANNEGVWNPQLYRINLRIARPWWATWWFRLLALVCIVSGAILAYRLRVGQIRKEANLKAEFERKIGDIELSALRAQMNPHFIFNCLNSIENYIIKNESVRAAEYINDFARLIRLILQNSRSQYIPLKDEIEALDLYLQMESLRFDNKFEHEIHIDPNVELAETDIPPMLIQPFVENAIWHGLIPKNAPGKLEVDISRQNGSLHCVIQDNGIGRQRSKEINASMHKRGKKSMGMLITQNRIDVLNEMYQMHATVSIHDLKDAEGNPSGTRVELNIPLD